MPKKRWLTIFLSVAIPLIVVGLAVGGFFLFRNQGYSITVNAGENGTVVCSTAGDSFPAGADVEYTITPDTGYQISSIVVDIGKKDENVVEIIAIPGAFQTYTFTELSSNHTLTVEFAKRQYTVNVEQATGGIISPSTTAEYYGTTQTFTFTPSEGYTIASITIDGNIETITANDGATLTRTVNVAKDHTVTATYVQIFTVLFRDHNGTVTNTQIVRKGADATLPEDLEREHYTFTGWSGSYTNIQNDETLTATYDVDMYTVVFRDGETDIRTEQVVYNSFATPPSDPTKTSTVQYVYTFSHWLIEGTEITVIDPSTYAISDETTFIAIYNSTLQQYTVTFEDYNGSELKVQTVDYGTDATPPSNPTRTGYTFTGWSGSYTNVQQTKTVTAQYTQNIYPVTVTQSFGGSITPATIADTVHGTIITFTLTAIDDYKVVTLTVNGTEISVTNNGEETTFDITITSPTTFTATFVSRIYSPTSDGGFEYNGDDEATVIVIPDKINGEDVSEFDFSTLPDTTTSLTIPSSITNLDTDALSNLSNLRSITLEGSLNTPYDLPLTDAIYSYTWVVDGTISTVTLQQTGTYTHKSVAYINPPQATDSLNGWKADLDAGKYYITQSPLGSGTLVIPSRLVIDGVGTVDIEGVSGVGLPDDRTYSHIVIEEGISSIGMNAFQSFNNLISITIPDGVTSIGNYAFLGCKNLKSLTIPEGVTTIGEEIISGCSSLTSIIIPDGVTSIGDSAFNYCPSLESITIKSTSVMSFDAFDISITPSVYIYVPSELVDAYKDASGWNGFASMIYAIA